MLNRRRTLQTGVATLLSAAAPLAAFPQSKPRVKVRYNEVVRSMLYAPAYVAIAKGYFDELGLDVTLATAQGGDKSVAVMLSNQADIALIGPESAIYVQNSDSPVKIPIFCGLTSTDGFMLVGREKLDKFVGSWLAGQNQYAIFIEPDAAQLELDGKAHFLASIGETVGFADYTTFMATDKYIRENKETLQNWTNGIAKGMAWTAQAPIAELVSTISQFFPAVKPDVLAHAAERYRRLKIWKTSPVIEPAAVEKFQDILVQGHVLEQNKRVKFADLVVTEFLNKAK